MRMCVDCEGDVQCILSFQANECVHVDLHNTTCDYFLNNVPSHLSRNVKISSALLSFSMIMCLAWIKLCQNEVMGVYYSGIDLHNLKIAHHVFNEGAQAAFSIKPSISS